MPTSLTSRPWIVKILFALSLFVLVWSGISPKDRPTWILEAGPGILGFILIAYFWRKFPLTNLLLGLICIHAIILFIGGKYTYAEVPAGAWFSSLLGWSRNHYDRLGHFFQGLEPAILAREILLRKRVVPRGGWLNLFVVSICLAFSAFYELIEWATAFAMGEGSSAFLGTQGDIWDTQKDMFFALLGALVAVTLLARWHDRQLAQLESSLKSK